MFTPMSSNLLGCDPIDINFISVKQIYGSMQCILTISEESQLPTDNLSIHLIPEISTDATIGVVEANLHSTFTVSCSIDKPQISITARCEHKMINMLVVHHKYFSHHTTFQYFGSYIGS